jgi:DNA-binding response OmpR family regulator
VSEKDTMPRTGQETEYGFERKLVLVVDDDLDLCAYVREVLESADYRVRTVTDGGAALTAMAEEAPDILLLDIRLPVLSGDEIYRLLARLSRRPPIVLMTAGDRARAKAISHHNPYYLSKPFDAAMLLATVETALEGPGGQEPGPEAELDA